MTSIFYVDNKTKIEIINSSIISVHSYMAGEWWMLISLYAKNDKFIINWKKDKIISILIDSHCFDYVVDEKQKTYSFIFNNYGKLKLL